MGTCLWLVLSVDSQFAGLVMSTKEVKAISVVLSATRAINVTKVCNSALIIVCCVFLSRLRCENANFGVCFLQVLQELQEMMKKTLMLMILTMNFR